MKGSGELNPIEQSEGCLIGEHREFFPDALQKAEELPLLYLHMFLSSLFLSGA